jgi:hypothetical protein
MEGKTPRQSILLGRKRDIRAILIKNLQAG